jgi:hypothetical protein
MNPQVDRAHTFRGKAPARGKEALSAFQQRIKPLSR